MNVFEFLEGAPSRQSLPQVISLRRTTTGKYLFYLLIRHYRSLLHRSPRYLNYSRASVSSCKGLLEEISLFQQNEEFFVLEGFPQSFLTSLCLPPTTYVVAEVDAGELEAPAFSYKMRRGILRILISHLKLRFSLRELLAQDWGGVRDYAEVEVILRRALAGEWSLIRLSEELQRAAGGNILLMLKKGSYTELLNFVERYGPSWVFRHIVRSITQLATYRAYSFMGQGPGSIAENMNLPGYRIRELEEAAKAVSMEDLKVLATRAVELDGMFARSPALGCQLMVLRSGISMRRGR